MSQPNALIVPISVEALCVGQGDCNVKFVRASADFSQLPFGMTNVGNVNLSSTVLTTAQPISKPPGIYLHWAMPDGLATANVDNPDGSISIPHVPNRWLVARYLTDASNAGNPVLKPAFFMVESDQLAASSTDGTHATFPVDTAGNANAQPFGFLGKVTPIQTSWTEPDPVAGGFLPTLNVLGYGEPTFSALLPNCQNVFALYDSLDGVTTGTLTYVVAGWHSNPGNDPMSRPEWTQSTNPFTGTNNPFRWFFDLPAGAPAPNRSVYQGVIADIPWDSSRAYMQGDQEDISSETTVAIGNTAAEAIAAFIAQTTLLNGSSADPQAIEALLNALQVSAFSEITRDTPGGLADTEERIHEAGFGNRSGGTVWTIRDENGGDARIPADSNLAADLNALNAAQEAVDLGREELDSRKRQLFFDWVKYINLKYSSNASDQGMATDQLVFYLQAQLDAIQQLDGQLPDLNTKLTTATSSLIARLSQLNETRNPNNAQTLPTLRLSPTPAPAFWQPQEPVVVLSGPHLTPSDRHGGNGRFTLEAAASGQLLPLIPPGYLICLLAGQTVSSITVAQGAEPDSTQIVLHGSDLTHLFPIEINTGGDSLGSLLIELLAEALFLDPERAGILAAQIAALGGQGNPALNAFDALTAQIKAAISAAVGPDGSAGNSGAVVLDGQTPSPLGLTFFRIIDGKGVNPWIPIALNWNVFVRPVAVVGLGNSAQAYSPDFIFTKFALDPDEIDLHYDYQNSGTLPADHQETYNNSTVLSRHALIDLRQQIETLKQHLKAQTSDSSGIGDLLNTLNEIEQGLSKLPVMSQSLGGFNEALIMREQVLQLQIADPLETDPLQKLLTTNVKTAVGANNTAAPLPNNFYNPIRTGELRFDNLTIIDAFGRFKTITFEPNSNLPKLIISRNLQSSGQNDPRAAVLPARITQPARLEFRWLSAADDQVEMNSDPVTTPVCGWVLLNRVEHSLAIFDADGNAIGSFYSLDDGANMRWVGAPATDFFAQSPQDVFGPQSQLNRHLCAFTLGIDANGPAFLSDFLAMLDASLGLIEPNALAEDPATAVYFGRPIALARARLDLELAGLPAFDQSFEALIVDGDLKSDNQEPQVTKRTDNGFLQVQFPVRLGELSKLDDGLVGFFKSGVEDGPTDYETLFAPVLGLQPLPVRGDDTHILEPAPGTLTMTTSPESGPVFVSLLVDPRSKVHATTGIFPVKIIDIPTHHYTAALENMSITLLTAPILTEIGALGIPIPLAVQGTWSWLSDPGGGNNFLVSGIGKPMQSARFDFSPQEVLEGWLRLDKAIKPETARIKGNLPENIKTNKVIAIEPASAQSLFHLRLGLLNPAVAAGDANPNVIFTDAANDLQFQIINPAQANAAWSLTGAPTVPAEDSFDPSQGPPSSVFYLFWPKTATINFDANQLAAPADWAVQLFTSGANAPYLGFGPTANLSVQPGASIQFTMKGVTASPGQPNTATLELESFWLTQNNKLSTGLGNGPALIQAKPAPGKKTLDLDIELLQTIGGQSANLVLLTLDGDDDAINQLFLSIHNPGNDPLIPPTVTPSGNEQIVITYIQGEDHVFGALAKAEDVENYDQPAFQGGQNNLWNSTRDTSGPLVKFKVTPNSTTNPQMLGASPSDDTVVIELTNIVSHNQKQPDTTQMIVTVSGIPNYNDRTFQLELDKEFPPGIGRFTVEPALIGVGGTVTLSWEIFGVYEDSLKLEGLLAGTITGAQVGLVKKDFEVTLTKTTQFTLSTSASVDCHRKQMQCTGHVCPPPRFKLFTGEVTRFDSGLEFEFRWEAERAASFVFNGQTLRGDVQEFHLTVSEDQPLQFTYTLAAIDQFGVTTSSVLNFGWQEVAQRVQADVKLPFHRPLNLPVMEFNDGAEIVLPANDPQGGVDSGFAYLTATETTLSAQFQDSSNFGIDFGMIETFAGSLNQQVFSMIGEFPPGSDGGYESIGAYTFSTGGFKAVDLFFPLKPHLSPVNENNDPDNYNWCLVTGDAKWLLVGGESGSVKVVDLAAQRNDQTATVVEVLPHGGNGFGVLAPNDTTGYLIIGNQGNQIQTFQLIRGATPGIQISPDILEVDVEITAAVVSPDGLRLYAGSSGGEIFVMELDPQTQLPGKPTVPPISLQAGILRAISVAPQGTFLIASDASGLYFVPLKDKMPLSTFTKVPGLGPSFALVPNAHSVVVQASDDFQTFALLTPGFTGGVPAN